MSREYEMVLAKACLLDIKPMRLIALVTEYSDGLAIHLHWLLSIFELPQNLCSHASRRFN